MLFCSPYSRVRLWRLCRLFLLCFLLLSTVVNAQLPRFSSTKYLALAERIDQDTAVSLNHLKNEEFLKDTLNASGELTGYFQKGNLRKMHCVLRYSFRIDEKTFYIDQDRVFLVRHSSRFFAFNVATGEYRYDSLEAPFIGMYFFESGKLLHFEVTEDGHHFESEEEDIEYSVGRESELWIHALKRTAPKE